MTETNRRESMWDRKVGLRDIAWLIGFLVAMGMQWQVLLDVADRQHKYIGQDGSITVDVERPEARIVKIEKVISIEKGEVFP